MLKRLKASRKQQQRERASRFLEAARIGDLEKLLELIRNNIDINIKNENDLYALHLAAKEGHTEVIKELLKRGAVVNAVTKKGNSALHIACLAGQLEAVKILVENGANIDIQSQNGFTPLYMAAQENHESLVKLLLARGADAAVRNDGGFTPLDIAVQQGHGKLAASLVENDPSNTLALPALHVAAKKNDTKTVAFLLANGFAVNSPSKSGFSALHIAARYGNYEVCKALIDKGADVNWKAKNDITPLHVSSREGHSSVVELLLNSGAQLDSQTADGLTALHCAAVNGHDQVLDSLVRSGASLSSKTKNGLTPLHMALQGGRASCTRQLLQYNAPIDDTTEEQLTPLHIAAHCGNLRSAQILLDSGCDVDPKATNGFTPLHIACMRNHQEMVGLLLQHGANIHASTDTGLCPLHVAAFVGFLEISMSLIRHGANPDALTKQGMTALYLATLSNKTEMIRFLLQSGATVDAATIGRRTALHVGSELGNEEDVRLLLEHGALPGIKAADGFSPLDFATRTGNQEIVQLLLEHGALHGEESFQKRPTSSSSSLAEFSMIRDELKYMKGGEIGVKTPKLKRKPLEASGVVSPSPRLEPCGRDSRLSHVVSSLSLPDSPSLSFWSSFLTDARGGEMIGCRHSGVRIILPPSKVPRPMGITCKLIRKEKLLYPPPVKEGEALACRALETSPAGSEFLGPVIFEVPHFASLRGQQREITILRSDNGKSWSEHISPPIDNVEPALKDALLSEMARRDSSLVHIVTIDLPRFFALISRIRMEQEELSVIGGVMTSTLVPKVKISFPEDSFVRKTKVGLQAQPIQPEMVSKILGDQAVVSPVVTIEPRRRKFHHSISMTIPMSDAGKVSGRNLKLLCSISKGSNPALWEDITDLTPLTAADELVSFTTSVSGKYWLLDFPDLSKVLADVQKLYSMAVSVPFLAKFVVFAKRLSVDEGRLRIFCMTDDRVDKTLERQEQFVEVARSGDVEVLEGTAQYIILQGNLLPLGGFQNDQLHLKFHAFRENRLPLAVLVTDTSQEARSTVTFRRDPGVRNSWSEICSLQVILPNFSGETSAAERLVSSVVDESKQKQPSEEPEIQMTELRLKDIAELIGEDWKLVAGRLGIMPEEVEEIVGSNHATPSAEALAMLQHWVRKNGSNASGDIVERSLRDLGMDDIIASCMCNVADVADFQETVAARNYLDKGVDPLKVEIGSVQDLGSSRCSSVQHRLSPDAAYEEENLSKMAFIVPDAHEGDNQENKHVEDMFRDSCVGERFPFMDRSISTVSTNPLTTLPSDGEVIYQSVEEISSADETILKAEMEEDERMLEDGTCVKRKVVTIRHIKRRLGSEDALVGVEVEEDVLELAPGVELPLGDDVDVETYMENYVENLSNGAWLKRKVTTTRAKKILSKTELPDKELQGLLSCDFSESKEEPAPRLYSVDRGDFLKYKPAEVEEELIEEKTQPVVCSWPQTVAGWQPEISAEDQIEKETVTEALEGESEDERGGSRSSRCSSIYKGPQVELNFGEEREESTADDKLPLEKHARVILKRCVHKKTVIRGCTEETVVTEDTHVEQDNETPNELKDAIRLIIEQFVLGESNFVQVHRAA